MSSLEGVKVSQLLAQYLTFPDPRLVRVDGVFYMTYTAWDVSVPW